MAQKISVTLTDDTDPGMNADETIVFALDGAAYEIDLASANARKLRSAFQPWIDAGRKTGAGRGRRISTNKPRPTARSKEQVAAIRDWANRNGYKVSAKGRIPLDVEDAYNNRPTEDQAAATEARKKARVAKALASAEARLAEAKQE